MQKGERKKCSDKIFKEEEERKKNSISKDNKEELHCYKYIIRIVTPYNTNKRLTAHLNV